MDEILLERLRSLLERVSDTYSDFVTGVITVSTNENLVAETISYIENNPKANSSDIIGAISDKILFGKELG